MAGRRDIVIEKGATFRLLLTWKVRDGAGVETAVDLTGYTARAQIRQEVDDASVLLSMTTEDGGITLGGAAGTIALYLSDDATEAVVTTDPGVWDLELEAGGANGDVTRLLEGKVKFKPEVTR